MGAHKGVDYAAPTGTPVRATGNAKVTFAGRQNGSGNVIELRHQGAFSTLYAHLSRIAPQVRNGARVAQGEVIGYVGQTGWATGPHLHYEFRVGGEQRNPLTVAQPASEPLAPAHRLAFAERAAPAVGRDAPAAGSGLLETPAIAGQAAVPHERLLKSILKEHIGNADTGWATFASSMTCKQSQFRSRPLFVRAEVDARLEEHGRRA